MNTNWIAALTDTGIKTDLSTLAAGGTLSYSAAVQILTDVANRGTLSTAEFNDLQTIASHLNQDLAASDYVASAYTQLVNGNPANVSWNGGSATATPLGNLQTGSTSTQLNELVGKWFLGTDLPDPSDNLLTYTYIKAPLYGSTGTALINDIMQGGEGDCEALSGLIETALNHPDLLKSMIVDNGNGSYGVRFYINGNETWVTVNNQLPENKWGSIEYAHDYNQVNTKLWAMLVEKAYAQLSETGLIGHPAINSYNNISADPPTSVLPNLTNCSHVDYYYSSDSNWTSYKNLVVTAVANHEDVVLETTSSSTGTKDSNGNTELVASHAFAVMGFDTATGNFIVRNPWGNSFPGQNWNTQFEVSMATIAAQSGDFVVDNSALTTIKATSSAQDVAISASMPLSSLFSIFNPSGLSVTQYMFQVNGSGYIQLNGVSNLATADQTVQGQVIISAADLAKISFAPGPLPGHQDLMVSALVGSNWSQPNDISLTVSNKFSKVIAPNAINTVATGATVPLTSLFNAVGPANVNNVWFEFIVPSDGGTINLNGVTNSWSNAKPGQVMVLGSDLARLTYSAPLNAGPASFQAYANDGNGWTNLQIVQVNVGVSNAGVAVQSYANGQVSAAANVVDAAVNIFSNLDSLQKILASGTLKTLAVNDGTPANASITGTQFGNDKGAINLLHGNYNLTVAGMSAADAANCANTNVASHLSTATVSDSSANIGANLDGLQTLAKLGKLTGISATDFGTASIVITADQMKTDAVALQAVSGNYSLAVTGSAVKIAGNLDTLQGLAASGKLTGVTLTDGGVPVLSVSAAQFSADAGALAKISGNYTLIVTGETAAGAITAAAGHLASLAVADTAANVQANLDALQALAIAGKLATISLTDSATPTFSLTANQLVADAAALHDIVGHYNVSVPGLSSGVTQFLIQQDTAVRSLPGLAVDYPAAYWAVPSGANAVTGFQSANFTGGYNAVVLDYARANYALQADGDGKLVIKDIGAGDATYGQSITVTGANYAIFGGAAANSNGDYPAMYFLANSQNADIAELYVAALGRLPDFAGLEHWEGLRSGGTSLQSIATSFIGSDEFNSRFAAAAAPSDHGGPNDQAFVTAMYQNVLHRAPESAGFAFWTKNLANGMTRTDVLIDFALSAEDVANTNATPGNSSHWLIDTSKGGYADSGALLSAATVLNQGVGNGYINTALIDVSTIGNGVTAGPVSLTASGLTVASDAVGQSILLSSGINSVVVHNSNDEIFDSGNSQITVIGSNCLIHLNYHNDNLNLTGGGNTQVSNFVAGSGTTLHLAYTAPGATVTLLNGNAAPVAGANLNFGGSTAYVVNVGSVGDGSAAAVAAAINKAYTVADKSGEYLTFVGQDNNGSTEAWLFVSPDHNTNHFVNAHQIVPIATLIGVQVNTLSSADWV